MYMCFVMPHLIKVSVCPPMAAVYHSDVQKSFEKHIQASALAIRRI